MFIDSHNFLVCGTLGRDETSNYMRRNEDENVQLLVVNVNIFTEEKNLARGYWIV